MGDSRGLGRRAALQCLDCFLSEASTITALRTSFQVAVETDALDFFRTVVMPLVPKDVKLEMTGSVNISTWHDAIKNAVETNNGSNHDGA